MRRPAMAHYEAQLARGNKIFANLSRFHPDYGMTAAEHEKAKAERAAGKRKFVAKADLRAKREPMADRAMGRR